MTIHPTSTMKQRTHSRKRTSWRSLRNTLLLAGALGLWVTANGQGPKDAPSPVTLATVETESLQEQVSLSGSPYPGARPCSRPG